MIRPVRRDCKLQPRAQCTYTACASILLNEGIMNYENTENRNSALIAFQLEMGMAGGAF